MNKLLWLLKWILKAAIFFTLFAFALNNQQETSIYFFFGTVWKTSMVIIVLTVFASGVAVGVLGMVPRWLKHRHAATKAQKSALLRDTAIVHSTEIRVPAPAPADYSL
jgi:putative membrane protein